MCQRKAWAVCKDLAILTALKTSITQTRVQLSRRDALAVAFLLALTAGILLWAARMPFRLISGDWPTQWFPYYAFLGERLRAGDLPGWNPHQFSGMPFAANPASGWSYWPAMLFYTILPAEPATVAFIGFHLALAGLATYVLARALGLSAAGGVISGTIFLAVWTLLSIDQFPFIAVLTAWFPVALLGVDIGLRASRPPARIAGWTIGGIAIGQMLGTWLGQGAYYGLLLFGAWLVFRTLLTPPIQAPLQRRVLNLLAHGTAMAFIGFGLAAAGLLPRLEFNPRTNIPGGNYDAALAIVEDETSWAPMMAVLHLTGGLNGSRMVVGAAAVGLALLALIIARRWFALPFFAGVILVTYILALDRQTPLHDLFFALAPGFEAIHLHRSARILMLAGLPISLLAGAAVSYLWQSSVVTGESSPGKPRRNLPAAVAAAALAACAAGLLIATMGDQPLLRIPLLSLAAGAAAIAAAALAPSRAMTTILPVGLAVIILIQPIAQLQSRELGPNPARWGTLYRSVGHDVPTFLYNNPAAEFLRSTGPAWRYIGYDPALLPPPETGTNAYRNSADEPGQPWLLVDNWATWFGIDTAQGYNPILVRRYVEVINAINGHRQEYHGANIFPAGIRSLLLDLLSVRYIVVPAESSPQSELNSSIGSRPVVYSDDRVRIVENDRVRPRAWLVHEARQVSPGQALAALADASFDPAKTAIVEAPPPPLLSAVPGAPEEIIWVRSDPDLLKLEIIASAPALLVLSDVWDPAWTATVDGVSTPVLTANHAFRAVAVPAGRHSIELRFESASLRAGVTVTILTIFIVMLGLVVARRR